MLTLTKVMKTDDENFRGKRNSFWILNKQMRARQDNNKIKGNETMNE